MTFQIDQPIIYLITKGEADASNFCAARRDILDIIRLAVEENISLVQLREKKLSARLLFELTVDAAAITRRSATRLLVNDRADIAAAAKADGVHLAAHSLSAAVVRRAFPTDLIIGVSTHTLEAVENAALQCADFAVFGSVFTTPNKDQPQGIEKLAAVCEKLRPFPILALGGIDGSNVLSVMEAGAVGFAAIRALNDPESLRSICRKLKK